jgi:hypothetical protein
LGDNEAQRVENWGVVGEDKLAGKVYNRPGHRDGGTIVTSSVVEVRMLGAGTWPRMYPVAFTASGNAYRLGRPSPSFGVRRAEAFIYAKLTGEAGIVDWTHRESFDPNATIVRATLDTSFQHFEEIELYETSFKPL